MDKPRLLKRTLIVSAFFIAVIMLYWAKCQLGVNIFKDFAWESRFPILNALQRQERTVILPREAAQDRNIIFCAIPGWMLYVRNIHPSTNIVMLSKPRWIPVCLAP